MKNFIWSVVLGVLIGVAGSQLYAHFAHSKLSGATDANPIFSFTSVSSTVVTTSQKLLLPSDSSRQYVRFTNDGANPVYLELGDASTTLASYAIRLNATGGIYEMVGPNLYLGNVYASSSAVAGSNVLMLVY